MTLSVGIVGASGYAGGELLRLLANHPDFDVRIAAAGSNAGQLITDIHPGLIAYAGEIFPSVDESKLAELDLVFLALPHGESARLTDALPDSLAVVDLGADHRLADSAQWDKYYGVGTMAKPWTYGIPELPGRRAEIANSRHVASAGCYATGMELSLAPLLAAGLVEPADIVIAAASGTSGAGRKLAANLLATEVMGSMSPYKIAGAHQHTAEVEQELALAGGAPVTMSFTPLLAPMPRGIIATSTARLVPETDPAAIRQTLVDAYADEPFVHVLAEGKLPATGATFGSNALLLQAGVDEHAGRAVIIAALDNLGKGAAGQAIQNANIMFGLNEKSGLTTMGVST